MKLIMTDGSNWQLFVSHFTTISYGEPVDDRDRGAPLRGGRQVGGLRHHPRDAPGERGARFLPGGPRTERPAPKA